MQHKIGAREKTDLQVSARGPKCLGNSCSENPASI